MIIFEKIVKSAGRNRIRRILKKTVINRSKKSIAEIVRKVRLKIESEELVVYARNEYLLQGKPMCNYTCDRTEKNRSIVSVKSHRNKQTCYSNINLKKRTYYQLLSLRKQKNISFLSKTKAYNSN